jgi:hypothetical protein
VVEVDGGRVADTAGALVVVTVVPPRTRAGGLVVDPIVDDGAVCPTTRVLGAGPEQPATPVAAARNNSTAKRCLTLI